MKTSHIVIICVTVFLLVALWLSYKAMVLTAEKDERNEKYSGYIGGGKDVTSFTDKDWQEAYDNYAYPYTHGIIYQKPPMSLEEYKEWRLQKK